MNNNQRQNMARRQFRNALQNIPGGDEIWSVAVLDWVNNFDPDEVNSFTVTHLKEAMNGDRGLTEEQLEKVHAAFKQFIRMYHGNAMGGKRKMKKTRKSKKTRKTRKNRKQAKRTRKH